MSKARCQVPNQGSTFPLCEERRRRQLPARRAREAHLTCARFADAREQVLWLSGACTRTSVRVSR
jgi:hypothetical protein